MIATRMPGKEEKKIPKIPSAAEVRSEDGSSFQVPAWAPFAVIIITTLLYIKALSGDITSVDDNGYIISNPYLRDFSWHGVKEIFTSFYATNYHPLTTLTWMLEFRLFGLAPLSYHLVNVVLHLVNVWLVYKLAEEFSGKKLTAIIVCALFALHPMHVESVAWIAERKDVLYTAFYLASLICYTRYIQATDNYKLYTASLLLFLASLFSKSAAVTLPVVFIIIDLYKGRRVTVKTILEKLPFLALSVLFGILALMSQKAGGAINAYVGATTLATKFFLFTSSVSFYLIKAVFPSGFSSLHYSPYVLSYLPWWSYASFPFLLLFVWLVARRSPLRRELLFGISFFLITVSVMLQVIPVGSAYVAERYTYVSYIGLFYIIGKGISGLGSSYHRRIALGVCALACTVYTIQSWMRIDVWKNDTAIFDDMVNTNKDVYYTYILRARIRQRLGDLTGAIEDHSKAIELNPTYGDPYFKRGVLYDMTNQPRLAISDYNNAIKFLPPFSQVYNYRGWDLYTMGDRSAAITDLDKALELDSNNAEAYNNRGWIHVVGGDTIAAISDFDRSVRNAPMFDKPYYNRAGIKMIKGDLDGAIADYTAVIGIRQDDRNAYYLRGMAYIKQNNKDGACKDWHTAADFGNNDARNMLQQYCR